MVATWTESIDVILEVLGDWNRANTSNIKPIIADIATVGPELCKRIDMKKSDYVLCYDTAHNEEAPEILYDFVTTRVNITVDLRTTKSRKHMQAMENEIRRLIHTKRK